MGALSLGDTFIMSLHDTHARAHTYAHAHAHIYAHAHAHIYAHAHAHTYAHAHAHTYAHAHARHAHMCNNTFFRIDHGGRAIGVLVFGQGERTKEMGAYREGGCGDEV